ncbi:MAG: hypothetical protein M1135_02765 [Candidatus Omnitrophica bacterium]|jgi:hypothetical protein|nr:hypothetical protein [Candidatus Omnitrophota bacterium]
MKNSSDLHNTKKVYLVGTIYGFAIGITISAIFILGLSPSQIYKNIHLVKIGYLGLILGFLGVFLIIIANWLHKKWKIKIFDKNG